MVGKIYLINRDKTLEPMVEQPYESEDVLQQLLEQYPELLAGDQIDATVLRRLLLVSREIGVPGEEDGFDRWSLDHLFIDQEDVPTLVQIKQSTDTTLFHNVLGIERDSSFSGWLRTLRFLFTDYGLTACINGDIGAPFHTGTLTSHDFLGAESVDEVTSQLAIPP